MLQFEKIGMYPAPSFFDVNMTSGIVTASRPLTEDALQTNPYRVSTYCGFIVIYGIPIFGGNGEPCIGVFQV